MADPQALVVAVAAAHALEFVGLPEAQLNLSQAVIHLATAPKSNASALAVWNARADVAAGALGEVPAHLRDAHYQRRRGDRPRRRLRVPSRPRGRLGRPGLPARQTLAGRSWYRPTIMATSRRSPSDAAPSDRSADDDSASSDEDYPR